LNQNQNQNQKSEIGNSFIALVFANKECVFVQMMANIEHLAEINSTKKTISKNNI